MGIAIDRQGLKTLKEARRVLWQYIDRIEQTEPFDEEVHEWAERLAYDLDEYIDGMERR